MRLVVMVLVAAFMWFSQGPIAAAITFMAEVAGTFVLAYVGKRGEQSAENASQPHPAAVLDQDGNPISPSSNVIDRTIDTIVNSKWIKKLIDVDKRCVQCVASCIQCVAGWMIEFLFQFDLIVKYFNAFVPLLGYAVLIMEALLPVYILITAIFFPLQYVKDIEVSLYVGRQAPVQSGRDYPVRKENFPFLNPTSLAMDGSATYVADNGNLVMLDGSYAYPISKNVALYGDYSAWLVRTQGKYVYVLTTPKPNTDPQKREEFSCSFLRFEIKARTISSLKTATYTFHFRPNFNTAENREIDAHRNAMVGHYTQLANLYTRRATEYRTNAERYRMNAQAYYYADDPQRADEFEREAEKLEKRAEYLESEAIEYKKLASFYQEMKSVETDITDFAVASNGDIWFIRKSVILDNENEWKNLFNLVRLSYKGEDQYQIEYSVANQENVPTIAKETRDNFQTSTPKIAIDQADNLYISIPESHLIQKYSPYSAASTEEGILLETFAGKELQNPDGSRSGKGGLRDSRNAQNALFYRPGALAVDEEYLYVLDYCTVRRVPLRSKDGSSQTQTLAGERLQKMDLNDPMAINFRPDSFNMPVGGKQALLLFNNCSTLAVGKNGIFCMIPEKGALYCVRQS